MSADVLVYFGALDEVLVGASRALRPDGLLIFTVEEAAEETTVSAGYRLNPHGRYSHTRAYVLRTLRVAAFAATAIEEAVLRTESARPVAGLVVTARAERT